MPVVCSGHITLGHIGSDAHTAQWERARNSKIEIATIITSGVNTMKEYILAFSPDCRHVWLKRVNRQPKQCQRCKHLLDYPGHTPAKLFRLTFNTYGEAVIWADEANKIASQCKDVDELLNEMKKK